MTKLFTNNTQKRILANLILGYTGYYFCRSNLSVAAPLLIKEFSEQGLDKIVLGGIASSGVFVYSLGKISNGLLGDFIGGKTLFIIGMLGSVTATVLFGLGWGVGFLTIFWILNRYFQSMGWVAILKTVSLWFGHLSYARAMGLISLSFLFGDALARWFFGSIIQIGFGWKEIFFLSAFILFFIAGANYFFLPKQLNLSESKVSTHPNNLYADKKDKASLKYILGSVFKSPSFWMVLIMSVSLTLIRETFNFWVPTYLIEVLKSTPSEAAKFSLLFPLFGGISVIFYGFLTDKSNGGKKSALIIISLIFLSLTLFGLAKTNDSTPMLVHLILLSLTAFLIIGPYSFLGGAMSLDLGGKIGSSTVAGLVDSAGYFGASFSGVGVAVLASKYGWGSVFTLLSTISFTTIIAALYYSKHFEADRLK